ncbi:Rho guanine nucleotide exchange factor [Tilletia horrida]|nr:Rho guanine nucleotide exchange factor [Tilletia horrida]
MSSLAQQLANSTLSRDDPPTRNTSLPQGHGAGQSSAPDFHGWVRIASTASQQGTSSGSSMFHGWTVTSNPLLAEPESLPASTPSNTAFHPINNSYPDRKISTEAPAHPCLLLDDPEFLLNMSIVARDVPLQEHTRGSLVYPDSFTGRDLITTLQAFIPAELFFSIPEGTSSSKQMDYARIAAIQVADALRQANHFHDVEWEQANGIDSDEALYTFSDDMLLQDSSTATRIPASEAMFWQIGQTDLSTDDSDLGSRPQTGSPQWSVGSPLPNRRQPTRSQTLQWSDTISPEIRNRLNQWELERQNAIAETIEKEQHFLADLELLQDLFVEGIRSRGIIVGEEYDSFVKEVFDNHKKLASHIRALVEELHVRQAEHQPLVRRIGDLFLNAVLGWREQYCAAMSQYPFAIRRVKREEAKNPEFRAFLAECMREPRAQRHSLANFLYRPIARLPRYALHFKAIMSVIEKAQAATQSSRPSDAEASQELETLTTVVEILDTQIKEAEQELSISKDKVDIARFAEAFAATANRSEFEVDMDLQNPQRKLHFEGPVFLDGIKLQAILFDNYFVLAREAPAGVGASLKHSTLVVARRPIPVELLEMSGFNAQSTSMPLFSHFMHPRNTPKKVVRQVWPFTIGHSLRRTERYALTVAQLSERLRWERELDEAHALRASGQDPSRPWTVSKDIFASPKPQVMQAEIAPSERLRGTVCAAAAFTLLLNYQQAYCVALGTEHGVFIDPQQPPRGIRRALHFRNVTQLAVMEGWDLLFVLADKVLWVCRLQDMFVQSTHYGGQSIAAQPQRVSKPGEEVAFFNIGVLDAAKVVIYAARRPNTRSTTINTLELRRDTAPGAHLHCGPTIPNTGLLFMPFATGQFEVETEVFSLQFRRAGVAICTAKGLALFNLGSQTVRKPDVIPVPKLPKKDDLRGQALLKRMKESAPMAIFKVSEDEFLLCFNKFGTFVTADRAMSRDGTVIEWETQPTTFVYRHPYLLAISQSFIEIRAVHSFSERTRGEANTHARSTQLVQCISGRQIRLVNSQANGSVDRIPAYNGSLPGHSARPHFGGQHPSQDAILLSAVIPGESGSLNTRACPAILELVPHLAEHRT